MSYLVDANVLSEGMRPVPAMQVVGWLRRHEQSISVDPVVVGEIRLGILVLPPGRRRATLERWFDEGVRGLRCLPWDAATGLAWAELLADLRKKRQAMPIKDSLIAATALVHGLTVVTRNRADFEKAGVDVFNPFADD